jgi:hypothetical protein
MLRSSTTILALLAALPFTSACPTPPVEGEGEEGEGEEGEGEEGEGEAPGDGCDPVDVGNSVCDVQDPASDNHVGEGGLAELVGVIATSQKFTISRDDAGNPDRFGVFVSDAVIDERSGVLITFTPATAAPPDILPGDVLNITGTVEEFTLDAPNSETRVAAQTITADGTTTPLAPLVVDAAKLANEADGEDYEGLLVTIEDVAVTELGDFGQFTVTGDVVTDDTLFRYTALDGETFTSITGVVGYNVFTGGGFRLLPRSAADVVSDARPTNSVTDLNDGTVARCDFDAAGDCPAFIEDAVVVSPVIFDDDDRFPRFLFWVADANGKDADGRLLPKSGVMVSVLKNTPPAGSYNFAQDGDFNFLPGSAPEIGDVISMGGRNTEDFEQGEFEALDITKTTTTTETPAKAVLPALFGTGGRDAAELKGGRPDAADGDFPGLEGITAAANITDWQGVLVELKDVTTTEACYAQVFDPNRNATGDAFARDFGNFLVTGDVEIGDLFRLDQSFGGFFDSTRVPDNEDKTCANVAQKCEDSRVDGQTFTKLVGIVNFSFNVHRVNPRDAADLAVSSGFVAANTPAGNCPAN